MATDPAHDLSEIERDAITELANIGVSRAAANLRKMVGRQVVLSVPSVDILSRRSAATLIGEREEEALVAVEQSFSGAFDGQALLIFPQANSLQLIRAIIGEAGETIDPSEIEQEALAETGNIILNSCLGTIANMLRNSLALSLPSVRRGSGADLFDSNAAEKAEGLVLFLYINFSVRDRDIRGYIAMLMDLPALAAMRSLIGDFVKRYLPPDGSAAFDAQASLNELHQLAGPLLASIEHSGMPVGVTDPRLPDTPFIFVNPAFTRLTGYTLAELAGKSWVTLHGSETERDALDGIEKAMHEGQPLGIQLRSHRKDGAVFQTRMLMSPVMDAQGKPVFYLATHEQVHDAPSEGRSSARRSDDRSAVAERLRAMLSISGGAAAWEWDIKKGRIIGDERFASLYGLPFDDVANGMDADNFYSNIHPDDQIKVRLAIDGMLQGAEAFSKEFRIVLPSGVMRWVHARGYCVTEFSRPIRFTGVLVDTTDQKRVQEQLRIAQTAGGVGTFEYVDGFATCKVSPQFCNLLGLHTAGDLPVRTINDLTLSESASLIESGGGKVVGATPMVECQIRRPGTGEVRWLARRGEYIRDAETAEIRFSGVIYDITDLKLIEQKLRDLNDVLEDKVIARTEALEKAEEQLRQSQKMEAIGQITGGVAHDFNNLLTIIVGNLELLQRRMDAPRGEPQGLARAVDSAMRGAQRAATLTQRLLAFSRQQPLDPKPVDVGRLVSDMSDLVRRTIGDDIVVETVLSGGLWRAHVDANQLEMALLNLTVNARDAMPRGGKLRIETSNAALDESYARSQPELRAGEYVLLAVTDNGTGMDQQTVLRAFEPFFTTKDVGHGTGLGLSQVYGFVRQSGGHVKIHSALNEGTTVKIYLPRWYSEVKEGAAAPAATIAHAQVGEVILVVEDDDDVRAHTCNVVSELGYTVLQANSGKAAIRLIETHPEIALLFTDVGLPGGMNGRQLAETARRIRQDLKILFTTGYARDAIVHEGRLDPGVSLVTKPFAFAALSEKLRTLLDRNPAASLILVVEDEPLIQMLTIDHLEELGLQAEIASTAVEARSKLELFGGSVSVAMVDVGLPDARGDDLILEFRKMYPGLPLIVASGHNPSELKAKLHKLDRIGFLGKPYTLQTLSGCLKALGVLHPSHETS